MASTQEELFHASSNWGNLAPHDIDVCWRAADFTDAQLVTFRSNVRFWIEFNIGRVSDLRFHGWGSCPANQASSHFIQIETLRTRGNSNGGFSDPSGNQVAPAACVGAVNCGFQSSFATEVSFGKDGVGTLNVATNQFPGSQGVVLHEFMHALGFAHEFDRPDNSAGDCLSGAMVAGSTYNTPLDHNSIMNQTYCGGPTGSLTAWDVVGLQRAYGAKPNFSIVGAGNKCVDIDNPSGTTPTSPTRLQAWDCIYNSNQTWAKTFGTSPTGTGFGAIAYGLAGGYAYMDVQWGNSANGTPVWNWTFNNSVAQQWNMSEMAIVGMGDMCLEVPGGAFSVGVAPKLAVCNAGVAQQWDYFVNPTNNGRYIRTTANTNLCLTATGGTGVSLQTCDYTSATQPASQRFGLGVGHIQNGSPTQCLDVLWATPTVGQTVQFIGCRATDGSDQLNDAQRWYFRSRIRGLAGKCLDFDAPSGFNIDNGTKAQIWDCLGNPNTAPNQFFDFHF